MKEGEKRNAVIELSQEAARMVQDIWADFPLVNSLTRLITVNTFGLQADAFATVCNDGRKGLLGINLVGELLKAERASGISRMTCATETISAADVAEPAGQLRRLELTWTDCHWSPKILKRPTNHQAVPDGLTQVDAAQFKKEIEADSWEPLYEAHE